MIFKVAESHKIYRQFTLYKLIFSRIDEAD